MQSGHLSTDSNHESIRKTLVFHPLSLPETVQEPKTNREITNFKLLPKEISYPASFPSSLEPGFNPNFYQIEQQQQQLSHKSINQSSQSNLNTTKQETTIHPSNSEQLKESKLSFLKMKEKKQFEHQQRMLPNYMKPDGGDNVPLSLTQMKSIKAKMIGNYIQHPPGPGFLGEKRMKEMKQQQTNNNNNNNLKRKKTVIKQSMSKYIEVNSCANNKMPRLNIN
ncbi:MAG: hypothetical protein EZS28_052083 [Streblomastix strix]|uniref:Uncharacterized protein n=1 Tax=Streblomastix strix TaxID=222440 RepID=A0A5J4SKC7_9EUKA|nr:MAG: hypothetical protein EZS28_052083 [Streblomastix strix]